MSLTLHNLATEKQLEWLKEHNYVGNLTLTKDEAEQLINEYIEQERLTYTTRERGLLESINKACGPNYLADYKRIKEMGKE